MKLVDMDEPGFLLPDWVVTQPRLTGICGSDAKQVFMDFGEVRSADNPMKASSPCPRCSATRWWPTWSRSVPRPRGSRSATGSCSTRGSRADRAASTPICPACEVGDYSLC